ncbi:hypothetical protein J3B02_006122 [Coemansia erecta]|uniref:Uncharacterized protein n=1 Tax=Coemansia asiatica TaxID=1052880 RepID=A0A9W8CH47_9FUNG|nr:hypothetical protein LPJ64_005274 [Coemansia asiatica]KAJ2840959.1 hypothetical protein J3B02_006122 [Coemansia erecta]KAJ2862338.1 hypothetical protein FB639_005401 [Coemansia asiatica]
MSEYLRGVRMIYIPCEEDGFNAVEFPFDEIGSYREVHDIPRYNFELERQVEREVTSFRDEMTVRTMHLEHQRRPARRRTHAVVQPPKKKTDSDIPYVGRANSTPIGAIVDLSHEYDDTDDFASSSAAGGDEAAESGHLGIVHVVSPDIIKTRLPAIKKKEERPKTSRLRTLFKSKTRQTLPDS